MTSSKTSVFFMVFLLLSPGYTPLCTLWQDDTRGFNRWLRVADTADSARRVMAWSLQSANEFEN
jgi:hypothetical protein